MATPAAMPVTEPTARVRLYQASLPFLIGGTSGIIATMCIQPLDMIKVRLQLAGEGSRAGPRPTPLSVTREILAKGRFLDLYQGLSAGLLRQVVYGTSRLGFFFTFEDALKQRAQRKHRAVTFAERAAAGLTAGGLGASIGNPAEVALIRMQADGLRPKEKRANYRSVFDALARITRNEGFSALYNGCFPTVVRAMATNFGQLAFFSEAKHQLTQHTSLSEQSRTISASFIAGFFASFFSLPFDFAKTRLQRQIPGPDGSLQYKGLFNCFQKVMKEEGFVFYRGFGTYFMRIAPHSVMALIAADNLRRIITA